VKGRLFVVLPTGVETSLPFACNAPFIQDPARIKIKDPEISPTNRWLLERVGRLAASVMLQWLSASSTNLAEKSRAYDFFPSVEQEDRPVELTCESIINRAFQAAIQNQAYLLTCAGELKLPHQSVIIPQSVLDVWTAEQAAMFLDDGGRPAFSPHV